MNFLYRIENGEAHHTLITYWPSVEIIKKFADDNFEKAKNYPEDNDFLLEFEEKVVHQEVFYKE